MWHEESANGIGLERARKHRSAAQNGWLNSLPRLSMPSEAQLKDPRDHVK